jgi:hypothetical protein
MTTTITMAEKRRLENKAKVGWKNYFILRDDYDELAQYYSEVRTENRKLIETIKSGGDVDIEYLKKQFLDLYEKVGELTNCPVCFETLTKANSEVPSCGHLICKGCKQHICNIGNKECPICKSKYWISK